MRAWKCHQISLLRCLGPFDPTQYQAKKRGKYHIFPCGRQPRPLRFFFLAVKPVLWFLPEP